MSVRRIFLWSGLVVGALAGSSGAAVAQNASTAQSSGPEEMKEVVVTGIRRSIADSLATKRAAGSVVDVISAEDVGKFPDSNVADSLARLPGVTVDRQFGEGEQLSIAGVEPALNRLVIDGHSVASADWGGNPSDRSSRTFNYSLLSPTIISQAIVYKTPEARIQEGAIGGSVDVITRKPLDSGLESGAIFATGGYEFNDRAERGSARGSALFNWKNSGETFGVLIAGNYDKEQLSRAGAATYWYRDGSALLESYPRDANGNIVYGANGRVASGATLNGVLPTAADIAEFSAARHVSFLAREFFKQERERIGFSAAMQLKPSDDLLLTATGLVIRGNYDNLSNSEYTYGYEGSRLLAAEFSNGVVTSATFQGLPAGSTGATGQLDTNFRRTRVKNDTFSLLAEWTPGEWSISGNVGTTKASGGKDPEYLLDFRTQQGFTSGANGRLTMVNWDSPASDATKWLSNFTALGGELQSEPAVLAANNGQPFFGRQIGGIARKYDFTLDKENFGEVNFKRAIGVGPFNELLFGARYADHDNNQTTYGGAVFTNQNYTLADLGPYVLDSHLYDGLGTSGNGTPYATLDRDHIIAALETYGTINVSRGLSKGNYFQVNEKISGAYTQANFKAGRFRGNIGGRYVRTRDASTFYVNEAPEPITETRDDNRFLPAANLVFDAGEDVALRMSYAKVIARPRYSDLSASTTLNDATRSGSGGNPDLKPYAATNIGLSAEWYFTPSSFLAGELFYRDISNYISNKTADVELTNPVTGVRQVYNISTATNGGGASVTGFSVSANTDLWGGFGVQTSFTFADAQTDDPNSPGLPYLSRYTFTLVPYFERGPIQARISYNRRSEYFYRFGRLQSQDYTAPYRQLDAQLSYTVSKGLEITATASNLIDETYYQYSSDPRYPTSVYKNGRVFSLSATFRN